MFNQTVQQFFTNYSIIRERGFEAFAREQAKLFSPDIVTIATDHRGTLTYEGIVAYFASLVDWFQYFGVSDYRLELVEATRTYALARRHCDVQLLKPVNGKTVSAEGNHEWTEEFELTDDRLIKKLDVKLILS